MAPKILHQIDELLRSGKHYSAATLAKELDISARHVKSCIEQLRTNHNAPIPRRSRQGYFYTDPTFALKRLLLTPRELNAVRRALLAAQEFGGVGAEASLTLLTNALIGESTLPPATGRVSGAIHPAPGISVSPLLLDDLEEARRKRRRVRIVYWSAHNDEVTERIVRPYVLHNHLGEQYLISWCELRDGVRDFLLTRIREWKVLDEDAAYTTTSFDVDAYISKSFGVRHGEPPESVTIRFTPYQARWIRERQYHVSQVLTEQDDGGVLLTLQVTGTFEIKRWVLGFGAEAEVLEPKRLRDELAQEAKKLHEIYAG